MKYSVFTVMTPEFTPEELVGKLAHLGYEGIEWRVATVLERKKKTSFWKANKCSLFLQTLKDSHGLKIKIINFYPFIAPAVNPLVI